MRKHKDETIRLQSDKGKAFSLSVKDLGAFIKAMRDIGYRVKVPMRHASGDSQ